MRDGCTDDGGVLFGVESISSYCDFTLCDRGSVFMTASFYFDCNANKSIERTTVEIMARGLIVYSLSCTSVRVGGWEDC